MRQILNYLVLSNFCETVAHIAYIFHPNESYVFRANTYVNLCYGN